MKTPVARSGFDIDDEPAETYWALGNLLRRQGHIDGALQRSQNRAARPNLALSHRNQARYQSAPAWNTMVPQRDIRPGE